jgi:hypothetical protein
MNRITPIPGRNGTTSILLLAVLILALGRLRGRRGQDFHRNRRGNH